MYGGSGWAFVMDEESMASREVTSCEVTFASLITRRKSLNHWAVCWLSLLSLLFSDEGEFGSADWWFNEGWVKA